MSYQQLIPCSDEWYYVHENHYGDKVNANFFRVAAWASDDDGFVVGLLGETSAVTKEGTARLVAPPKLRGMYVPATSLTAEALKAARGEGSVLYEEVLRSSSKVR